MPLAKLFLLTLLTGFIGGCANGGTAPDWAGIAILPNLTNVPTVHYTPDGFDPPYDYY